MCYGESLKWIPFILKSLWWLFGQRKKYFQYHRSTCGHQTALNNPNQGVKWRNFSKLSLMCNGESLKWIPIILKSLWWLFEQRKKYFQYHRSTSGHQKPINNPNQGVKWRNFPKLSLMCKLRIFEMDSNHSKIIVMIIWTE